MMNILRNIKVAISHHRVIVKIKIKNQIITRSFTEVCNNR